MRLKLILCIFTLLFCFICLNAQQKNEKKDKIFILNDVLSHSQGNIDSIYAVNHNKINRYQDIVKYIGYEDIGDYNRIHVRNNNHDYYFLDKSVNGLHSFRSGDIVKIYWRFVENHAIDDPSFVYIDISITNAYSIN